MRVTAMNFLYSVWQSLGNRQIHFIPQIVEPILRVANVCFILILYLIIVLKVPQNEVATTALNMYYTILQAEFQATKSLKQSERVTAVVLDEFIAKDKIDEQFKDLIFGVLEQRFKQDSNIANEGMRFLNQTIQLMNLISAVQKYKEEEEDLKTSALLEVMNYAHSIGAEELYYKYIHALANCHAHNQNFVEAGMALLIHINKLSFDSEKILPKISNQFPQQTGEFNV